MALSTAQGDAAALVAADRLTNEQIGAAVGVARKTIERWKAEPAFAARVQEITEAARAEAMRQGIAVKAERIRDYQELRARAWRLIEARAAAGQQAVDAAATDDDAARVLRSMFGRGALPPGIETGLMVKTIKVVGKVTEEEWAVDTGLLSEIRNLDKQAAQELGEWTEKREVGGLNGGPALIRVLYDDAASAPSPSGSAGGDTGESPV